MEVFNVIERCRDGCTILYSPRASCLCFFHDSCHSYITLHFKEMIFPLVPLIFLRCCRRVGLGLLPRSYNSRTMYYTRADISAPPSFMRREVRMHKLLALRMLESRNMASLITVSPRGHGEMPLWRTAFINERWMSVHTSILRGDV